MSDTSNVDKVVELALEYYEVNASKNSFISKEKKVKEALMKEMVNEKGTRTIEVSKTHDIEVGFMNVEDEEIDPKLFFKMHPEKFWEIVSIAKTTVIAELGEKEAAKLSRTVQKNTFKVKRVKK